MSSRRAAAVIAIAPPLVSYGRISATRDDDALVEKAKLRGVHVGIYAERLLGGPLPWNNTDRALRKVQ